MAAAPRAAAQEIGVGLTATPSPVVVSNTLTYTLTLTNRVALVLPDVTVSALFSEPVTVGTASNPYGTVTYLTNGFSFVITSLTTLVPETLTYSVAPLSVGSISNVVTVSSTLTNVVAELVTSVTGESADLGVALSGVPEQVVLNDFLSYEMVVTNLGPSGISGVYLTNTLAEGFSLIRVTPTNLSYTVLSNLLVFNLGTVGLTNGDVIGVTLEATNAGNLALSASVGAAGLIDTNIANNFAAANVSVVAPVSNVLSVAVLSPQTYNPQTGLVEEVVQVTNTGTNTIQALRINLVGLTNVLFNALGTNGSAPYVLYQGVLGPGQSVPLTLEYFSDSRSPGAEATFVALGVPATTPVAPTGALVTPDATAWLSGKEFLLEFPSAPGQVYTIVYSDSPSFSNLQVVAPAVTAQANETQWIDHGPPETVSPPSQTAKRFYRVVTGQ